MSSCERRIAARADVAQLAAHFMAHIRSPGEQLQVFSFFGAGFFFSVEPVSLLAAAGFSAAGAGFSAAAAAAALLLEPLDDFAFACETVVGLLALACLVGVSFGVFSATAAVPVAGG